MITDKDMLHALFQLRLNAINPAKNALFRSKLRENAGRISSCTHFKWVQLISQRGCQAASFKVNG
ncbi:MAG: hypothetical protein HYX68_24580 [Planctomycetes bacterium]|nr:hypothetical protein [Planctomycetota bacterium]